MLRERVRAHVEALGHVLWEEAAEGTQWDLLPHPEVAFLDAARAELAR